MMTAARFWGSTAALLCALLLQNCQPNALRVTEEERPSAGSALASGISQDASNEPAEALFLSLPPLSSSSVHVSPSRSPITPANKKTLAATPSPRSLSPSLSSASVLAAVSNSSTELPSLQPAASSRASYVVPLRHTPRHAPSTIFTTASGERVQFSQVDGQWRAAIQAGSGVSVLPRILPVVNPAGIEIEAMLSWLQTQDSCTSRARIHILNMSQAPYGSHVYLGRMGLLGGMPESPSQGGRLASSTTAQEKWVQGPTLHLSSDETLTYPYTLSLPPGARFTGYRLQPGSVVTRASWTAWYVGEDSRDVISNVDLRQSGSGRSAGISATVADIISLSAIEGTTGRTSENAQRRAHVSSHSHAALVLYGKTKRNKLFRRRSQLKIALDVSYVIESSPEDSPASHLSMSQNIFPNPLHQAPAASSIPVASSPHPTAASVSAATPVVPSPIPCVIQPAPAAAAPFFEKEDNHVVSAPPNPEPDIDFSSARVLHEKKMTGPVSPLTESESIDLLTMYVSDGAKRAQEIVDKDAVIVIGNTGAGKSTFLNYLLGCRMALKSLQDVRLRGRRSDEVMTVAEPSDECPVVPFLIGHGKESETFMPQIAAPDNDSLAYCDCPGFLDNRGAETNIANAVNIRRVLQAARSVRIVILISDKTFDADRCRGLTDMLRICTQLFGSADNIKKYKESLLLGVTRAPGNTTIDEMQGFLQENTPEIMKVLSDRLFLYDPMDGGGEDFWDREQCLAELKALEPIRYAGDLFQTVLDARDEKTLRNMVEQQGKKASSFLRHGKYDKAAACWQTLQRLRVIDQLSVERLLNESKERILGQLAQLEIGFKEACYADDMDKAKKLLDAFGKITHHFSKEEDEFDLPSLEALKEYYAEVEERKKQKKERDRAHEAARIQAAKDKQELLNIITSQKVELERNQEKLTRKDTAMREELEAELAGREEAYKQSLSATQKELEESLRRNEEALSMVQMQRLSMEEINRLLDDKKAMQEDYAKQLENKNKEWLEEKQEYDLKLAAQQAAQAKKHEELQSKIDLLSRQHKSEEQHLQSLRIPEEAFGAKAWKDYFGVEVGTAPLLPANIDEILNSSCPFWPGKQVKDTHLLVLVPATVNSRPFTLDLLGELIKSPQGSGSKTQYRYYDGGTVQEELGAKSPGSSYWVLMTRDVLPGSRSKTYDAQKELVAAHARRLRLPYKMPDALSAATAILLHHARTGERLYTDDPWTYTRCQEKVLGNKYPVIVGGFSSGGLYGVLSSSSVVSCLRKF
jgi:energy-coupling factor transporter ATP-binding protein EcfA2